MSRSVALIATPALLLAGCATAAADSGDLAGSRWTIVRIDGATPVVPQRANVSFERDRFSASVGCNGMGGTYRVKGARLVAGPVMATQMFCQGPVWQQEQAVTALLSAAPEIQRHAGTLRLVSGGHTLELERASK